MKKNIFSFVTLVLAVLLTFVPSNAWAGSGTVTVKFLKSNNTTGVSGGIVQYYAPSPISGWVTLCTTDVNGDGSGSVNLATRNATDFKIVYYGGTKSFGTVNFTTNPTLTANTTPVTVKLETCTGTALAGKAMWYAGSAWGGWNTIGNTPASTELLSGSYSFAVYYSAYNGANSHFSNSKNQNISVDPEVLFNTTKVTLNYTGTIYYYENSPTSGWVTFTNPSEMLPGTVKDFKFGSTRNPTVTLAVSGCTFTQTGITIEVLQSNGSGRSGATAKWWDYGQPQNVVPGTTNSNGILTVLLGAGAHTNVLVQVTYEDATPPFVAQNPNVNSIYVFQMQKVTVELRDNAGALIDNSSTAVSYWPYGKPERPFGTLSHGKVSKDLLLHAGGLLYKIADFNKSTKGLGPTLNTTVVFQTGKVLDGGFGCATYQAWYTGFPSTAFTDGIQLLDHGNVFGFSKPGTTKTFRVYAGQTLNLNDGSYTTPKIVEQGEEGVVASELPTTFGLSQNYPNPFNPVTTIMYALPVDANVSLVVYDALGQKVAQLVQGTVQAGYHQVSFDAAKLASGVYFYRISALGVNGTNFTRIQKMILMK
jgi:hypothetical protein